MAKLKMSTELFSIPHVNKYLIYSPLKGISFFATQGQVNILYLIQDQGLDEGDVPPSYSKFVKRMKDLQIVNGEPDEIPLPKKEGKFEPTTVNLFPTSDCNLRCTYCYARGGETHVYMSLDIAKSAIDLIVRNALSKRVGEIKVNFHGGGEPTLGWDLLVKTYEYAKCQAEENGLRAKFSTATNGVLSSRRVRWLAENFDKIIVSFDGTKQAQDLHRPKANGSGSFRDVFQTMKILDSYSFPYSIRATISSKTVNNMKEMVVFCHENLSTRYLHVEPVFSCGRCEGDKSLEPQPSTFIRSFIDAKREAEKRKVKLFYSGASLDRVSASFCGVSGENFAVTPDGYVTSCQEVCSPLDFRASFFMYGSYGAANRSFLIDHERLNSLRISTVNNVEYCSKCFCKWHCAGDCLAKVHYDKHFDGSGRGSRCEINRGITKFLLVESLKNEKSFKEIDE